MIVYVSPERCPRRVGRRLDLGGRGRARDGAGDEHRLLDADRRSSGSNIGSDLRRKIINDAAASLRGLATTPRPKRRLGGQGSAGRLEPDGRRGAEAERDRHRSRPTLPALLDKIDGETTVPAGLKLHTANAEIVNDSPGFVTRFLSTILDPNLLSLLFLAGIAGIAFEIFHPGIVLPGALGAVSLLLALFGLCGAADLLDAAALVVLGAGPARGRHARRRPTAR